MANTIMVGIDGSEDSRRAVKFAASQAKSSNARLVLAYVIEWSPYTFNTPEENEERHQRREEELKTAHKRVLDPEVKSLESQGIKAAGVVRHGHVADVLLQLGKEQSVNQIVVGRIGHATVSSLGMTLVFGSVAAKLIQLAEVPVTVVP